MNFSFIQWKLENYAKSTGHGSLSTEKSLIHLWNYLFSKAVMLVKNWWRSQRDPTLLETLIDIKKLSLIFNYCIYNINSVLQLDNGSYQRKTSVFYLHVMDRYIMDQNIGQVCESTGSFQQVFRRNNVWRFFLEFEFFSSSIFDNIRVTSLSKLISLENAALFVKSIFSD